MFVLDTDHLTLLEWGALPGQRLRERLSQLAPGDLATTIISFEEQTRGWLAYAAKAKTMQQQVAAYGRLSRHLAAYREITVLDFSDSAAVQFQGLQRQRVRIGAMDLKIAAITLTYDATLLTRNLADFRKVPRLKVEDWSV